LLSHVPLGPLPWLHQLRPQLPRFVRRLQCYYEGVIAGNFRKVKS
jgi:hypothetical protein